MAETVDDLIIATKKGDESAFSELCRIYAKLIDSQVSLFKRSLPDIERDDLHQDAVMALYKATMNYDVNQQNTTFGLYAKICISHRLISTHRKQKTIRKQQRSSINAIRETGAENRRVPDNGIMREKLGKIAASTLSPFEYDVFTLFYFDECSCKAIAAKVDRNVKSVENALYRIKKKLRGQLI